MTSREASKASAATWQRKPKSSKWTSPYAAGRQLGMDNEIFLADREHSRSR